MIDLAFSTTPDTASLAPWRLLATSAGFETPLPCATPTPALTTVARSAACDPFSADPVARPTVAATGFVRFETMLVPASTFVLVAAPTISAVPFTAVPVAPSAATPTPRPCKTVEALPAPRSISGPASAAAPSSNSPFANWRTTGSLVPAPASICAAHSLVEHPTC